MKTKNTFCRSLCALLSLVLMIGLLPLATFAEEPTPVTGVKFEITGYRVGASAGGITVTDNYDAVGIDMPSVLREYAGYYVLCTDASDLASIISTMLSPDDVISKAQSYYLVAAFTEDIVKSGYSVASLTVSDATLKDVGAAESLVIMSGSTSSTYYFAFNLGLAPTGYPTYTPIDSLDVTVTEPVKGNEPNYTVTMTEASQEVARLEDVEWKKIVKGNYTGYEDSWATMLSDEPFDTDTYYYAVYVTCEPKTDYVFSKDTAYTVNEKAATEKIFHDRYEVTFAYAFAPAVTLITSVSASIEEPVTGNVPDFAPTITSVPADAVELDYFTWYKTPKATFVGDASDSWTSMTAEETFSDDYYYSVDFYLSAKDGYIVSADITGTVNEKAHDDRYGTMYEEGYATDIFLSGDYSPKPLTAITSVAATITEPVLGALPDYEPTLTSASGDELTLSGVYWFKIPQSEFLDTRDDSDNSEPMEEGETFEEGYYYAVDIYFKCASDAYIPYSIKGTVNGKKHDDTFGSVYRENVGYLSATFEAKKTVELPFTKTVEVNGEYEPSETTFQLETFGGRKSVKSAECTASVVTNGAGDFEGKLTVSGPASQVNALISSGFYVREKNDAVADWTYSDATWYVEAELLPPLDTADLLDDGAETNVRFSVYAATLSDDGTYQVVSEIAADKMTFVNVYEQTATTTTDGNTTTTTAAGGNTTTTTATGGDTTTTTAAGGDTTTTTAAGGDNTTTTTAAGGDTTTTTSTKQQDASAPSTGDNGKVVLWSILLLTSAAGVVSTTVLFKKKQNA